MGSQFINYCNKKMNKNNMTYYYVYYSLCNKLLHKCT